MKVTRSIRTLDRGKIKKWRGCQQEGRGEGTLEEGLEKGMASMTGDREN